MKAYTKVTRKTVEEDRMAICPEFGCESIIRVKPLKFGFLGFGKYPKCKKHHIPLVYVNERIGEFVDAALACLFDRTGLPSNELLKIIHTKFPEESETFIKVWVYCITIGRGAGIVSHYMDSISNTYLKKLTTKQIKSLKKTPQSKNNSRYQPIREGMNEITNQYTRLLKHLRIHSEVLIELDQLKPLSKNLKKILSTWQETILKDSEILPSTESKHKIPLTDVKINYDKNLNAGICRCLLGLSPESKGFKKNKLTAFDRFSAYYDFYIEGLTEKFTKSDIERLFSENRLIFDNLKKQRRKDVETENDRKYNKHYFSSIKGSKDLRFNISLYFFELIMKSNYETPVLINILKRNLSNNNFNNHFSEADINLMQKMIQHNDFDKYLTDLGKIIRFLMNVAKNHKKIGATPNISHITTFLREKNINLFQADNVFPMTIAEIYDLLQNKNKHIFPKRGGKIEFTTKERKKRWKKNILDAKIIGSKIKIYIIRNIYNGFYIQDGKAQCPLCRKEGLDINTDISRLKALEFHHKDKKNEEYTARKLFLLFQKSYGNPNFLEKVISTMEKENIELICRNHHNLLHSKVFKNFKELINWTDLFSLDPILIHLLIHTSVHGYINKRKHLEGKTRNIRKAIVNFIKKRYILERLYNGYCPICQEINSKYYLPSFDFHHLDEDKKTIEASFLFGTNLSCSEIIRNLEKEFGVYICKNCHGTYQWINDSDVVNRIYESEFFIEKVGKDIERYHKTASPLKYTPSIQDPLKKEIRISNRNIKYLFTLEDIINSGSKANNNSIASYLKISEDAVRAAMRNDVYSPFLAVSQSKKKSQKSYHLTEYGKKALKLMHYFKDYYDKYGF